MQWVIGIDEVGRGPLAGPVCVCAVAMPKAAYAKATWDNLTDSKKMTTPAREAWEQKAQDMKKKGSIQIGISMRSASMIDQHGISSCIRSCIGSALKQLSLDPNDCTVLLDGGLKAPAAYKKQKTIIRGDSAHPIISLASVVAKVRRDNYMRLLHKKHANYRFDENKGYGTLAHRTAIRKHGPTAIHRKTFISKVI